MVCILIFEEKRKFMNIIGFIIYTTEINILYYPEYPINK